MITLRPYQQSSIRAVYRAWMRTASRRALVVLPTGCGKTITALSVVAAAHGKGHRVLWLAHREELLAQPMQALEALWPDVAADAGIVQAHHDDWHARIALCSIDTLARPRRLERVLSPGPPRVVVVDEAQHSAAGSWARVLRAIDDAGRGQFKTLPGPDDVLYLGLTATPDRADGKPLGDLWRVAHSYPISEAIRDGYLVPPRFVVQRLEVDLSEVASRAGDWDDKALEDALMRAHVVEHTAAAMATHARGLRSLVFTVTVRQAELTAEALTAAGLRAAVVHGGTPTAQRRDTLAALRRGDLDAICNCAVLTEGYDDPSVDCIVIARPTRSKPLYVQMVGRGLRIHPGKSDCLVLDLVGASVEHDLVVSAALLTVEREHGSGEPGEPAEQPDRSQWAAFLDGGRGRQRWAWAPVPDVTPPAYALGAGDEGTVALIEQGGGYLAVVLRKGRPARIDYPAGAQPLDHETAQAAAEDFVRQAEAAKLAGRRATWRTQPTSAQQRALLDRLGLGDAEPRTKGDAEKLITGKLAQGRLVRGGLCERVDR